MPGTSTRNFENNGANKKFQMNISHIGLIGHIGLMVFIGLLFPHPSFAQKNTISVVPQITRLDLSVDKPEAEIIYTNNTLSPIELSLTVENVKELEDRNPVGILDPKESANYKYALASWVYLDRQNLIISPGEKQTVKVTIDYKKLSPGGHYGAVLAELKQSKDNKEIKLKAILTSLLFVRASTGNEIEEAQINFFGVTRQNFDFPKSFILRFQNTGNVDLTPFGLIEIRDQRNKLVAKGIVNEGSLITLPEAIRRYDVPIIKLEKFILPGKYNATLFLHYGKSKQEIKLKTTFITQGSTSTSSIITVLGVLGGAIIAMKIMKHRRRKTGVSK